MMRSVTAAFNLDLDPHGSNHGRKKREINGLRPSPLRIHKDSHLIHKPSSSNSSSSSGLVPVEKQQQQRRPIIIYTQSPKIIHTKPQDFMALVQKLTGRSRSDDRIIAPQTVSSNSESERNVTREDCDGGVDLNEQISCLPDIPLFTPTSASDFFCSPNKSNPISPSFLEFLRGLPDC